MLTEARTNQIAEAMAVDTAYAEKLLQMSLEGAVKEFREKGYDFTEDELREFGTNLGKLIEAQKNGGELDENALEDVSGGCWKCAAVGTVVGAGLGLAGTILLFAW